MGHAGVSVSVVSEGHMLNKPSVSSPLGGMALSQALEAAIRRKGHELVPAFEVKRTFTPSTVEGTPGTHGYQRLSFPATHPSLRSYFAHRVLHDIKASHFSFQFHSVRDESDPAPSYELPDGTALKLDGIERDGIAEALFNPARLAEASGVEAPAGSRSVQDMLSTAIASTDPDLRKELYGNVILTGGGSFIPGITEKVFRETVALVNDNFKAKLKIHPSR